MAASGEFCWPSVGTFLAAYGENLMAVDTTRRQSRIYDVDPELRGQMLRIVKELRIAGDSAISRWRTASADNPGAVPGGSGFRASPRPAITPSGPVTVMTLDCAIFRRAAPR